MQTSRSTEKHCKWTVWWGQSRLTLFLTRFATVGMCWGEALLVVNVGARLVELLPSTHICWKVLRGRFSNPTEHDQFRNTIQRIPSIETHTCSNPAPKNLAKTVTQKQLNHFITRSSQRLEGTETMKGRQGGIVAVAVSACVCGCGCACVRVRVRVCDKTVAVLVFSLYHGGKYFKRLQC